MQPMIPGRTRLRRSPRNWEPYRLAEVREKTAIGRSFTQVEHADLALELMNGARR